MNAFFISCEITRHPELQGRPAAVAGDPKTRTGIILAANYKARAFGVKTAMVLHEALRLCPDMLLVPPDHHFYSQKSKEVMELLSHYTPVVEQNSIDEAWLDMTGTEALFGKPDAAAKRIMEEIKNSLGLFCSIGIAENKFLAKMASEMKKPLGITELWQNDIQAKLHPLPVNAMYGIGRKTTEKLNMLGIMTIGDLAKSDAVFIAKTFGKFGLEMHGHANGIDQSPVVPHKDDEMKSIGRETTLSEDVTDIEAAKQVLMELSDSVGMTARKHNKKGRTVHIVFKYNDFSSITRQMTVPLTFTTKDIYQAGCRLMEQAWNQSRPVRLIGITLSGFEDSDSRQLSFFDCIKEGTTDDKNERVDRAIDRIRYKHGRESITLAKLVKKEKN